MQALIVLFIIYGIANILNGSRRQKKEQSAKRRARADSPAPPRPTSPVAAKGASEKIPPRAQQITHEEMLRQAQAAQIRRNSAAAERPREASAIHPAEPSRAIHPTEPSRANAPKPAEPLVVIPNSAAYESGEGITSTQGESEAEHAEHLRRAAADEAANRLASETLRDLRASRRQTLQSALIMSEILNKPLSLRPRTGLHR